MNEIESIDTTPLFDVISVAESMLRIVRVCHTQSHEIGVILTHEVVVIAIIVARVSRCIVIIVLVIAAIEIIVICSFRVSTKQRL